LAYTGETPICVFGTVIKTADLLFLDSIASGYKQSIAEGVKKKLENNQKLNTTFLKG
jgi:hypothetical protein